MAPSDGSAAGTAASKDLTDLSRGSWIDAFKRTVKAFKEDKLTDWAAALTYYGVLAMFPALIALVSVLGLVGQSATQPLLDNLTDLTPGPANEIITDLKFAPRNANGKVEYVSVFELTKPVHMAKDHRAAIGRRKGQ